MPLTQEQIDRMDKLTGLDSRSVQTNRLQELQSRIVAQPQPKSFIEKVATFTGGAKIAQGLGQAIANPEIARQLQETQKLQSEMQDNLVKRIREKRALGEDTTTLDKALSDSVIEMQRTAQGSEKLLNQNELTDKQVIGDALRLGTTVLGAGTLPGGASSKATGLLGKIPGLTTATPSVLTGLSKGVGVGKGIIGGAKTGAIAGGAFGASAGVSQGLLEDKSVIDIAKQGVGGALVGAGTGGLLGGAIGGVSGAIRGGSIKKLTKEQTFLEGLVSPKATTAVKEQALREGRVTSQGLLAASKITPSKRDLQLADAVRGVVSSKNSVPQNITAIGDKVSDINTGVKTYVKVNKVPFNTKQLTTQLNKGKDELKLVFASDTNAKKTYDAVVKEFIKHVGKKDTAGLFEARQKFDQIPAIKKLLSSQGLGENTKKEVVLTVRGMANKYVASLLPKGNKFRETLLQESKMIEAMQNMAEKNVDLIGTNQLQSLTKKYPVLKAIAGGLGAGLGFGAVGVGSSIIGSTE